MAGKKEMQGNGGHMLRKVRQGVKEVKRQGAEGKRAQKWRVEGKTEGYMGNRGEVEREAPRVE